MKDFEPSLCLGTFKRKAVSAVYH